MGTNLALHEMQYLCYDRYAASVNDLVTHYIQQIDLSAPPAPVPVPNSNTPTASSKKPRTRKLAKAVADRIGEGTFVCDCIRWKVDLGSARNGGPRDPTIPFGNLIVTEIIDKKTLRVLIDYVSTSGGHLRACAAKLKEKGATVGAAFWAGKTFHEPAVSAFSCFQETLEDYNP